jgi:hypothetical protein
MKRLLHKCRLGFRFNAAKVRDFALVFGFETAENARGAAPQHMSAYSVRVHIDSGAPPPDGEHSEALLVQENGAALKELDRDLKPIATTTMNVTLKRVPPS